VAEGALSPGEAPRNQHADQTRIASRSVQ
jgi:hypothetical protein